MGRTARTRTPAEQLKKNTDSLRAEIYRALMLPENVGQVQETIRARERLANLFLTFMNHPRGFSFRTIRNSFSIYYDGNEESARRKFMRDVNDLEKLGLHLVHYPPNSPLPDGAIAKEHIYVPEIRPEYMPDLHLSAEERGVLAAVLIRAIVQMRREKDPSLPLLESAMCRLLYDGAPEFASVKPSGSGRAPSVDRDDSALENLVLIHKAIRERNVIEFAYGNALSKSPRRVEGRGLIQNREKWCLIGYSRESRAIRYYYLDRIEDLKILEEIFPRSEDFNIRDYSLHPLAIRMHEPVRVVLTVREEGRGRLEDLLAGIPEILRVELIESGAAFQTTNLQALYAWMLRNPGIIKTIEPGHIHENYLAYLNTIRGYYL